MSLHVTLYVNVCNIADECATYKNTRSSYLTIETPNHDLAVKHQNDELALYLALSFDETVLAITPSAQDMQNAC